jgi:preprotein translocase subunit SecF
MARVMRRQGMSSAGIASLVHDALEVVSFFVRVQIPTGHVIVYADA